MANVKNDIILEGVNIRTRYCRQGLMSYFKKDMYVGNCLDQHGEFSEAEISLYREIVSEGDVVLEVGANIGAHTVFLAKSVGKTGRVVAVEPQRRVFQMLCANIVNNELENVYALNRAMGSQCGDILIPEFDFGLSNNYSGFSIPASQDWPREASVQLQTIDSLELTKLDFLKIDAEGMECDILRGGLQTVALTRPVMYIENDKLDKSEELISLVFDMGYEAWWHFPIMMNYTNYFERSDISDTLKNVVTSNMLCMPKERGAAVKELPPVTSVNDVFTNYTHMAHYPY